MDELEGQMTRKHFYVLVNFTDEVMGISHIDMPDARDQSLARRFYFSKPWFQVSHWNVQVYTRWE